MSEMEISKNDSLNKYKDLEYKMNSLQHLIEAEHKEVEKSKAELFKKQKAMNKMEKTREKLT